jgi:very-short-patch-repair endonuclease
MEHKHNKHLIPFAKRLRKEMTKEERHLWYDFLRSYPVRFSRQKILGSYIADFYSEEAKLVIELDGSQHYEAEGTKKDAQRTEFLEGYGLNVLRIPNNEVSRNFDGVCAYIDAACRRALAQKEVNAQSSTTQSLPCVKGGGAAKP